MIDRIAPTRVVPPLRTTQPAFAPTAAVPAVDLKKDRPHTAACCHPANDVIASFNYPVTFEP